MASDWKYLIDLIQNSSDMNEVISRLKTIAENLDLVTILDYQHDDVNEAIGAVVSQPGVAWVTKNSAGETLLVGAGSTQAWRFLGVFNDQGSSRAVLQRARGVQGPYYACSRTVAHLEEVATNIREYSVASIPDNNFSWFQGD